MPENPLSLLVKTDTKILLVFSSYDNTNDVRADVSGNNSTDIAVHFCEAYGYGLEIRDMSFDAVLPAVQTGKCDFGGAGISITEERKESVLFSEPNFTGGTVLTVLKADAAGTEGSSFSILANST